MSSSKNERNEMPAPTETELENLLSTIKPRPTARLHQQLSMAPWHAKEGKSNMIRIRKLEYVATGAAVLLLVVIAAVLFLQWSPFNQPTIANGPESNQTAENAAPSSQTENNTAPSPTRIPPTPTLPEGALAWTTTLPAESSSSSLSASGIAYETSSEQGWLFVANGYQGVHLLSLSGEDLGAISITDPETQQPVFVYDVAWSKLLWLGSAENEYGLFVLTEPFQSGEYLHIIDPHSKTVLQSLTLNNNIAVPMTTDLVSELPPTHLSASADGELYMDKVFTFAPEAAGDPTTSLHYLLRSTIDGRILNPMLVNQGPANEERPSVIADLAYQTTTDRLYAAVRQETSGVIQKFVLTGTPRNLATLDEELIHWQENVALTTDEQGYLFILVDTPGYIVELDQDDQVVNIFGFRDMVQEANYPAVTAWLPSSISQPLAMTITPDGSTLFIVDQKPDQINVTAFTLPKSEPVPSN